MSSAAPPPSPVTVRRVRTLASFPHRAVQHGSARGVPVRLRTSCALALFLAEHTYLGCADLAVVLDFDKVLTSEATAARPDAGAGADVSADADQQALRLVRGGAATVQALRALVLAGVPLFVATARTSPELLQELFDMLVARAGLGFLDCFGVGASAGAGAGAPGASPIVVDTVRDEALGTSFRRVRGTRVFSGGYEKGKLVAHLALRELEAARRRVVFVDDNAFNAHFVLHEAPQHIHALAPGRELTLLSAWWDPSVEQSCGDMAVKRDSDFSFCEDFAPCLATFGVDEEERARTEEVLLARCTKKPPKKH